MQLEDIIAKRRNTLRTDRLDMSFGELINLYEDKALFITPEYQRAFRWDEFQQTRFIESIFLGIPVPPIFVAEDKDGNWELVDGLQRISTILSFFGLLKDMPLKNNLKLTEGELVKELEGYTYETIPLLLKHTLKRAVCRVEILRWDSTIDMRYELFSRLNTGGERLTDQEIRNCIFRGYSNDLNAVLIDIAKSEQFKSLIQPTDRQIEEMYCEELVLRFLTLKNHGLELKTNLPNHLTEYMQMVSKGELNCDYEYEKKNLKKLLTYINDNFGYKIFRASNGVFAPHYYDSIMLALDKFYEKYKNVPEKFREKVEKFKQDKAYKEIGNKSYSQTRIANKINIALDILKNND